MKYRFEEIARKQKVHLRCSCGNRVTRTVSVMNTINPYNKDENGSVKDRQRVTEDVLEQLSQKVARLTHGLVFCKKCADVATKSERAS